MGGLRERARETLRALERLCRAPYFVALYGLIAVILVSPAASNGLQTEDHLQRVAGWSTQLYPHGSGDVFENYHQKDAGFLPWIASDDLKISFFRPLASLSLAFDYQVLPANPAWPYVDSFFWLFLLTVSAALLFRQITASGAPRDVEFRFAWPLENERFQFVGWNGQRYTKIQLPEVGGRVPNGGFFLPAP